MSPHVWSVIGRHFSIIDGFVCIDLQMHAYSFVPAVPRIIAQKSQSMHLGLSELQKILCATDWHIDGSLDLQLMWDPVAWTVAQMEISQGVIESPSEGVTEWNENNTLKVRQNIMSAALGNLLQVETEKLPSYYGTV